METIIGIDLGTTNSSVSSLVDGKPLIIDIDGSPTMPSCVGIDNTGKLLVGQVAVNQFVSAPESTILSIKRSMGEEKKVSLGGKEFTPEEISSFILRKLKDCANKHLGEDVKKAVITVPAYFNDRQRKATQDAGALAGLEVVRIINEPTAAAIAYEANKADNERILVYDLGGGTFDVSLVVVEDGVVEVKASHGDTRLGGDDFDKLLVDHVISDFRKQHNIDLNKDLRAVCRLKLAMEKAKCELSDRPFVKVREEYIVNDLHLEIEIAREEYEDMIRSYLQKTIDCLHKCLNDASMLPAAIDKVMLVGGSTRTPLVYEMLKDAMTIEPRFEINPDLIVAMGAGIQGGIINGLDTHSVLVDITPYTFGTSVAGEFNNEMRHDIFVPVIPRNTPIPVSKSKVFFTMYENQEVVEVNIYQGEEPLVGDNIFIGNFIIEGLSKAPEHNPITLNLELDVNGMLKVTAAEKVTGLEKSVVMDTKNIEDKFDMEEAGQNIRSIVRADGNSDEDMEEVKVNDVSGDHENAQVLKETEDLRIRAKNLLDSSIDEDDAEEIKDLLAKIEDAIKKKEPDTLSALNESLSDLVFYMED
ncbi:MAG: Hsp70 family protein [Candidatus Anammoxibacter sp.]